MVRLNIHENNHVCIFCKDKYFEVRISFAFAHIMYLLLVDQIPFFASTQFDSLTTMLHNKKFISLYKRH